MECPQCQKKLSSPQKLKNHINSVHNKLKPYKCEHCDFTASDKSNLKKHTCYKYKVAADGKKETEYDIQINILIRRTIHKIK